MFQEEVNITCITGAVRLTDGLTEYEGRVEICYDNHWGGVCGNYWDSREANVVCRQLGEIPYGEWSWNTFLFVKGVSETLHMPIILYTC